MVMMRHQINFVHGWMAELLEMNSLVETSGKRLGGKGMPVQCQSFTKVLTFIDVTDLKYLTR
jgi:hypothetical protein